jgi:multisubunit Na+/H+ antiporter MnhC subunit
MLKQGPARIDSMSAKPQEKAIVLTSIVLAFASLGQFILYFIQDYVRPQTQFVFELFFGVLIIVLLGLGIWAITHLRRI